MAGKRFGPDDVDHRGQTFDSGFNHHCDLVAAVSNNVVVLVVSVQVAGG